MPGPRRRRRPATRRVASRWLRPGRQLCCGVLAGLLTVPLLTSAIMVFLSALALPTPNQNFVPIAVPIALYAIAPTLALVAAVTAATSRRGRTFLIGVALGALTTLPPSLILTTYRA